MHSSPILSIHNLHVAFKTDHGLCPVVSGVNIQLSSGETLAIVGESGSGKTITALSILQLLGPLARQTDGEILFNGSRIDTLPPPDIRKIRGSQIGMIFQDPMSSLNPTISIGKQIAESLLLHENLSHQAAKKRSLEMLALVGIPDPAIRFNAYPFQLSGGLRQRVMIAMALVCKPKLLIADEPTTALDVTVQAQILKLLYKITRENGMSLLLITHDLGVVAGIADRVAVMQNGAVVETGPVEQILSKPCHPYTQELLRARYG